MSGNALTLDYHKGIHWNLPVHRARSDAKRTPKRDFAVYGD